MDEAIFELEGQLCQTLSHPNRLRIIHVLREGPLTVNELTHHLGLAQAKVSQHLAILRARGLVTARRHGVSMVYQISNPTLGTLCDLLRELLAEQAAERAGLLEHLAEERHIQESRA
jgi:ArsR family transcriptional regulator